MQRRDVLTSAQLAVAGGLVALAGCSSGSGGSTTTSGGDGGDAGEPATAEPTATATEAHTGCPPQDAAPSEVVPSASDAFSNRQPYDPGVEVDAAAAATMQYEGPDGAYYVAVYRFENRDATADGYTKIRRHASRVGPTVGFVMRERHVIFCRGQTESSLKDLLASSQYVGSDCLRNVRFE
jgi:hypothetical protein